jgi:hypothetical protein
LPCATIARSQQRYDHRLRNLVQHTWAAISTVRVFSFMTQKTT